MLRLLILAGIVAAILWLRRDLRRLPPQRRRQRYWQLGLMALAGLLLVLAATGRIHWLGALIGALLPLLRPLLAMLLQQLPAILRQRQQAGSDQPSAPAGPMSRAEALAILGLSGNPGREQIVRAHRQLIQRLHPDRGGNDYLASRVNAARELLLGELDQAA